MKQEEDGQLTKPTFWFMHPPADALSHYYMFNVENPTEIEFYGAKPKVTELGAFVVRSVCVRISLYCAFWLINAPKGICRERENKWNYTFDEGDKILRYKNYKTFTYEPTLSCGNCRYDAIITIPNLVGIVSLRISCCF